METSTVPQTQGSSQPSPLTAALFTKFNDYPWVKDRQFLQGLAAMLGTLLPSTDMARAASISLQARFWWFRSKQGVEISPEAYAAYLVSHPDAVTPEPAILARIEDVQRRMGMTSAVPSWQAHAPKTDLGVKAADGAVRGDGNAGGDAPYPEHFKAVIEAVTQGKAVPGVREIPNTVVRVPGISPVGKMQAPRKPWEKDDKHTATNQQSHGPASLPQDFLDPEFPSVKEETTSEQSPESVPVQG